MMSLTCGPERKQVDCVTGSIQKIQDARILGAEAHPDTDDEQIFLHDECELRLNAMIAAQTVFSGSIPNFVFPYRKNDVPIVPPTHVSEKSYE